LILGDTAGNGSKGVTTVKGGARVSGIDTTDLDGVTSRGASEAHGVVNASLDDEVTKQVVLIKAASKTGIKSKRRLAEAEDLGGSGVGDSADEVDLLTSGATIKLRAERKLAIALRTKGMTRIEASLGDDAVTVSGDSGEDRSDIVGSKVG